jgi:hypothetical protein
LVTSTVAVALGRSPALRGDLKWSRTAAVYIAGSMASAARGCN